MNSIDINEDNLLQLMYAPESFYVYIEVHIAQGPVLENTDLPLGLVQGIAGQTRLKVTFTVDIRAMDDLGREAVVYEFSNRIHKICDKRSVLCLVERKHDADAVACDSELSSKLKSAAYAAVRPLSGDDPDNIPVLVSEAGHDAMAMSHLTKDHLQKDCEEKVYKTVFWNFLYHDSVQLPALCLVWFAHCHLTICLC